MAQNLNEFFTWGATAYKQALIAYEDKKITLQEILSFLPLGMQVAELVPKWEAAWDEITNSDTQSIVSSLNHLESQLTFLKPETVQKIKNIVGAIMFGAAAVSGFKATAAIDQPGEGD